MACCTGVIVAVRVPYVSPVYQTIVEYPVKSVMAGVVAAVPTAGTTNVLKSIVSFCRRPGNNLSDAEGWR